MLIGHENKTDTKDDIMVKKNDCSVLYGFGPLFSTDRL
ncbi:entericidin B membrane lipoprotein [Klebsiella pneumoniae]|uniref:Entericidin B membrane lipoprotein n=1 Tax=Klebsiella pneumoniae TaxID=573 RepID=A0A2X3F779_KLEPN|nr:entericidin B membrane lipoprotein [Klebsiella pneumoniae]STT52007.1 entericidin B membrane lipoprotein [Klebsiella pneumoniae]VTM49005.1 entericidin B membrane lipoprotein [Klebsiella pneumoniae]VTM67408.1 entericidin B membrane lipoprotein [Klebsiella pneumoniae]